MKHWLLFFIFNNNREVLIQSQINNLLDTPNRFNRTLNRSFSRSFTGKLHRHINRTGRPRKTITRLVIEPTRKGSDTQIGCMNSETRMHAIDIRNNVVIFVNQITQNRTARALLILNQQIFPLRKELDERSFHFFDFIRIKRK